MPTPPANGVLLRRRTQRLVANNEDEFQINEDWYDPATRTAANYALGLSTDGSTYSRPASEVIDAYCLSPGLAPFTERRYSHAYIGTAVVGTGGVVFTDVANAPACLRNCTLTVSLTASAMAAGQADLTATPAGGVGALEVSLDDFLTPGLPATNGVAVVFLNQRAGTYTVTARETRPGGCRATATVTLVSTYGPLFRLNYKDADNAACEALIVERDYKGTVEVLPHGQKNPLTLDWPGGQGHLFNSLLRGSEAQLGLYLTRPDQLLPLFSGDERLHRVEHRKNGALTWIGYLQPEQYDVAFLAPPTTFNLRATDGLGTLSDIPFADAAGGLLRGDWSLLRILRFCLNKLDLGLPLYTLVNLRPDTAAAGTAALEETFFDVAGFRDGKNKPRTCGKVLADLLQLYQARLYQQDGAWWLERLSELTIEPLTYAGYSPAGVRMAADLVRPSLLATIVPPTTPGLSWRKATQRQNLRPAVARIAASIADDALSNALRDVLPTNADLPGDLARNWFGYNPRNTAARALVYAGKDKPPIIQLIGESGNVLTPGNSAYIETPVFGPRTLRPTRTRAGGTPTGYLVLSFTATPYGNTPATFNNGPRLYLAAQFGQHWLQLIGGAADNGPQFTLINTGSGGAPIDSTTPLESYLAFNDAKALNVRAYLATNTTQLGPQLLKLRIYSPVGGANTPTTVNITELKLEWYGSDGVLDGIPGPATEYVRVTGQQVSRTDEENDLFFSTTGGARFTERRTGTLLDRDALPVAGFIEPAAPGQFRDAGDYFIRDRAFLETKPAQVLTGSLHGAIGPGSLLTDPAEVRPGVYGLTGCSLNTAEAVWQVTAVQINTLVPPVVTLPENAIYNEDLTAWTAEDGRILVYENA